MENNFQDFTNLYELSKTLRFSLIPVLTDEQKNRIVKDKNYNDEKEIRRQDKMEVFFLENKKGVFEVDIERAKQYKKLKYYLTELHKLFIKDSLKKLKDKNEIDFSDLFENYKKFESANNDEEKEKIIKEINVDKTKLAKFFGDKDGKGGVFQNIAKEYYDFLKNNLKEKEKIAGGDEVKKFKEGTKNILLSQNILLILDKKIKDESIKEKIKKNQGGQDIIDEKYALNFTDFQGEKTNLIRYFKGWSTYFKNFNDIRGNLYKDDGRKEQDENKEGGDKIQKANAGQITTRILDENFEIFVKNAVWAEKNKKDLDLNNFENKDIDNEQSILGADFYINCLSQIDINIYNQKIGELNKFFNEKKQKLGKKEKIKYLKSLHKQLILTDKIEDEKDIFVEEFLDDEEFIKGLEDFKNHFQEKMGLIRDFFTVEKFKQNLDEILFNENQTHFLCNQFFGSWSYFRDLYYQQNEISKNNQSKDKTEFKDKDGIKKEEISLLEIKILLNKQDKKDFKEAIQKGNFLGKSENEKLVYRESLDNFENFVLFLKYYFDSLIDGRGLLTKSENKDLKEFAKIKEEIESAKKKGEKIDELLLKKVSEENFKKNIIESIEEKEKNLEKVFEEFKESLKNKKKLNREKDFEFKKVVNEYCGRISDINRFFTLFFVPEGIEDNTINKTIKEFAENNKIIPFYNEIRNFITKKGRESEKIKLNFENQSLLKGWGYKTKEHPKSSDYKCRIFRKNNKFYLGIIGKRDKCLLNQDYDLMDYYQLSGKNIFGPTYMGLFNNKYEENRLNLENNVLLEQIEKIIDDKLLKMFPKIQHELEKIKENKLNGLFNFKITKEYVNENFKNRTGIELDMYKKTDKKEIILNILQNKFSNVFDFEKESEYLINRVTKLFGNKPKRNNFIGVDKMVYEITKLEPYFYKTSFNKLNLEENNINIVALFQIYNKDFSEHKKEESKENLHTIYFKELFSKENEKEPIFKLSGGAEVFFREKIEDHKIEQWDKDDLKNPKTGKIPNKKRRFTENSISFHVPIMLNNINQGGGINKKIHEYIQKSNDVKILGIDRGEKELAYYCSLNQKGEICGDLKSMNETGSNIVIDKDGKEQKQKVNYQKKLDIKEKERMMARKSWTKIEGIKDLKKGYISNVVKDIADLMIKNNTLDAIVCLEELNYGFKRGRIRIEKNIYQQLENALVDKLGYLVLDKSSQGVRGALQLTPKNKAQKYWGNQMGAIFYTDAKFTSKTCPNCGFRKRGVSNFDDVKNIREKVKNNDLRVFFEKEEDRFRIEYNWKYEFNENNKKREFTNKDLYGKDIMEKVYSDIKRSFWDKKSYTNKNIDPNIKLKGIFKEFYKDNKDNLAKKENHFSYLEFIQIFKSILNIRNTIEKEDIISCPKCHFSTHSKKTEKIKNGDANGAYNIARKGLMVFEKIRSDELVKKSKTKDGVKSQDLKIILKEWDEESYRQWDKKDWKESENKRGL